MLEYLYSYDFETNLWEKLLDLPIYEIGEFSVNQKDSSCAVLKSKWDTIIYLTIPFYDGTNNKDDYRIGFYQISLNDLSYQVSFEMQLPSM